MTASFPAFICLLIVFSDPMVWTNIYCSNGMINQRHMQYTTTLYIFVIRLTVGDPGTLPQHFCEVLHSGV